MLNHTHQFIDKVLPCRLAGVEDRLSWQTSVMEHRLTINIVLGLRPTGVITYLPSYVKENSTTRVKFHH